MILIETNGTFLKSALVYNKMDGTSPRSCCKNYHQIFLIFSRQISSGDLGLDIFITSRFIYENLQLDLEE